MDAVGSNIRIDSRGGAVLRIMPVVNDAINEEWISDKTRFVWDGLARQRLDKPYIREGGKLRAAGWDEALALAAEKLKGEPNEIAALAGNLCDAESMKALKDLMDSLGVKNMDCRQGGGPLGGTERAGYILNTTINDLEDADAILLIGANPRLEAPLVNTRIRKAWISGGTDIGVIGDAADLTYDYEHIGVGPDDLVKFSKSTKGFINKLKKAKKPVIILGAGALAREDGAQLLRMTGELAKALKVVREGWNGFNVLHTAAARVGGLDMGFLPGEGGKSYAQILKAAGNGEIKTVFLLGADELDTSSLKDTFVIYQGLSLIHISEPTRPY